MAEARDDQMWEHTSNLLAMLRNVNRGPGQRAVSPAEFHPRYNRPLSADTPEGRAAFEQMVRGVCG